ncbi:hypothetical protein KHA80_07395 [Anaerobacillus sp. HL2]|nr:hypothetical protein KHA80_07395 [Anaerobacillus sp. HL2]
MSNIVLNVTENIDRSLQVLHQKMPQPRNLANAIYMSEISDEQLFQAIARGIPGTRMKAYQQSIKGSGVNLKQKFTDTEIWSLVEYVRRLSAQ